MTVGVKFGLNFDKFGINFGLCQDRDNVWFTEKAMINPLRTACLISMNWRTTEEVLLSVIPSANIRPCISRTTAMLCINCSSCSFFLVVFVSPSEILFLSIKVAKVPGALLTWLLVLKKI